MGRATPLRHNAASSSASHHVIAWLLAGLCLFYYLALASFHPYDASFFSVLVPAREQFNRAGAVGAWISSMSVYYFGLLAYALPPWLIATLIPLLRLNIPGLLRNSFIALASLCLIALALDTWQPTVTLHEITLPSGGQLGHWFLAHMHLWFGWWGSLILCGSFLLAFLLPRALLRFVGGGLQRRLALLAAMPKQCAHAIAGMYQGLLLARQVKRAAKLASTKGNSSPSDEHDIVTATSSQPPTRLSISQEFKTVFPQQTKPPVMSFSPEEHKRRTQLEAFFQEFNIRGKIVDAKSGPYVTTYAFKPEPGTKQSAIYQLAGDLALHLQVDSVITQPINAQSAIGLQIPNTELACVSFAELVHSPAFQQAEAPLPLALGVDVYGTPVVESLAQMPHLLIAGSTGAGKSVGLHSFICSLLSRSTPDECKLILIDPKRLELSFYEGLPNLLRPIITELGQALAALTWAIEEMEHRYQMLQHARVRTIESFNAWWRTTLPHERTQFCLHFKKKEFASLPYLVIVLDELADLVLQSNGEPGKLITKLAQKARACGIHMILATQRPSVDVLSGLIKANLPARISYRLTSSYDSKTILDQLGAEKLLGKGDCLWQKPGAPHMSRLHGAYITDTEIKALVRLYCKRFSSAQG